MHELSICYSILSQVETIAKQKGAISVSLVNLQIGPLSGVESLLLKNAWHIASANTIAASARLKIEEIPVKVRCTSCHLESNATINSMRCAHCGEWRTQLISGDEMLLRTIELEREENTTEKTLFKEREHV